MLALAITPALMTWRIDALHADGDATTGRAHLLTDSLKTLFVSEIILLEQVQKGNPHSGAHYREVRTSQERVLMGLRDVAPRISATATDRVNRVARLSARWHTVPDAFVARPITEGQATGEMSRTLVDRDSMLIAEQQLDGEVERVTVSGPASSWRAAHCVR